VVVWLAAAVNLRSRRHGLWGDDVETVEVPPIEAIRTVGVALEIDGAPVQGYSEDGPVVGDVDPVDVEALQVLVPRRTAEGRRPIGPGAGSSEGG
jgi:hypothetical protein